MLFEKQLNFSNGTKIFMLKTSENMATNILNFRFSQSIILLSSYF